MRLISSDIAEEVERVPNKTLNEPWLEIQHQTSLVAEDRKPKGGFPPAVPEADKVASLAESVDHVAALVLMWLQLPKEPKPTPKGKCFSYGQEGLYKAQCMWRNLPDEPIVRNGPPKITNTYMRTLPLSPEGLLLHTSHWEICLGPRASRSRAFSLTTSGQCANLATPHYNCRRYSTDLSQEQQETLGTLLLKFLDVFFQADNDIR